MRMGLPTVNRPFELCHPPQGQRAAAGKGALTSRPLTRVTQHLFDQTLGAWTASAMLICWFSKHEGSLNLKP